MMMMKTTFDEPASRRMLAEMLGGVINDLGGLAHADPAYIDGPLRLRECVSRIEAIRRMTCVTDVLRDLVLEHSDMTTDRLTYARDALRSAAAVWYNPRCYSVMADTVAAMLQAVQAATPLEIPAGKLAHAAPRSVQ